jgi:hypothetical protein
MKFNESRSLQNIPVHLPEDMRQALEIAEKAETWVNRERKFLEKQKLLHDMLVLGKSGLPAGKFVEHFSVVAAYSAFRENLALLRALTPKHPDHLTDILLKSLRSGESEYWGALKWRIRYAVSFGILSRVFSEDRMKIIKLALGRERGRHK